MPGASQEQNKEALLEVLKTSSHGVSTTSGGWCQVVIHDPEDLERSTVFITGSRPQAGTPRAKPQYLRLLWLRPPPAVGVRDGACDRKL
jgi:hypothetical protein